MGVVWGEENSPPVPYAGADQQQQITDGGVTVVLEGEVSDDGFPAGGVPTSFWNVMGGPGAVVFEDSGEARTVARFDTVGDYVLQLRGSDGELSSRDTVTIRIRGADDTQMSVIEPDEDVGTSGAFGIKNDERLRIKHNHLGNDRGLLKFVVSDVGEVRSAKLELTEAASLNFSRGNMTLRLFRGSRNDWTESTLTNDNLPEMGDEIGVHEGTVEEGETVSFDIGAVVSAPGAYTFVLAADRQSSRYVEFSSSEGVAPPKLLINPTSSPPAVTITNPADGAAFGEQNSTRLRASAFSRDLLVVSSELFLNGRSLGTSPEPAEWRVDDLPPGVHTMTVVATDEQGASGADSITVTVLPDVDPFDRWRDAYFSPEQLADERISGSGADPDGDGQNNGDEFIAGTSPTDAGSVFKIVEFRRSDLDDGFDLRFTAGPERRNYHVLVSDSLGSGSWRSTSITSRGFDGDGTQSVFVSDWEASRGRFFRVSVRGRFLEALR